jgi:hypothetical protein
MPRDVVRSESSGRTCARNAPNDFSVVSGDGATDASGELTVSRDEHPTRAATNRSERKRSIRELNHPD